MIDHHGFVVPPRERALGVRGVRLACAVALACSVLQAQSTHAPAARASSLEELLGEELFFDTTLSSPAGQACSSCHAPEAGFRFPDSQVNELFGVATGAVAGRFTSRSAPTIAYTAFTPEGPPVAHLQAMAPGTKASELLFIGGLFWDGHATTLEDQATFPFQNPNEMNNVAHGFGNPAMVVRQVAHGEYADLVRRVYGATVFQQPTAVVFADLCAAIASYERTAKVSPFSSKFDAYRAGKAMLSPEELDGLRLMTGTTNGLTVGDPYHKNAQCLACHGIEDNPADGPTLWTFSCYVNLGVPRNAANPFYGQTDPATNPVGYNPQGEDFVDFGLGDFLYPLNDLPVGNRGPGSNGFGDFLAINGAFKTPTLRNVDKRPSPDFVKAYMHNGVFKSLKEVVHFYNTRNLTTLPGEVIDFTQPDPYANLVGEPLWPAPEIQSVPAMINPEGFLGEEGGQVGNLGLTDQEEDHIVAFLKTLTDE